VIHEPLVEMLGPLVEWVTVCPECEIGLGVPRRPIRLVVSPSDPEQDALVQPATGADLTEKMHDFCRETVPALPDLDGCLMKYRSPSCGISNVRVHHGIDKSSVARRGAGLFGRTILDTFSHLPIEDEGRLHNFTIREHWLTRIFAGARLRQTVQTGRMKDLVQFHSEYKYLLMAYSQVGLKKLGRIVAAGSQKTVEATAAEYVTAFHDAMQKPARYTSQINVLHHVMGYFSDEVDRSEVEYMLDLIEEFRRGGLPLSVPLQVLRGWAVRFRSEYILSQAFLAPYPKELTAISDSGKGRKL
jgi:uncharacterized protein YbgA (DUF1722 family)/uncharacterized protein YbbK (DUF523 family)